jgi:hypothetical protein
MNLFGKDIKISNIWRGKSERNLSKLPDNSFMRKLRKIKGGLPANEKLLRGIYDGSNQDFALSSYILTDFINIPANLAGIPGIIPEDDSEKDNALIKQLTQLLIDEFPIILKKMLITGTAWRWPVWSDKARRLQWEAIPDDAIKQIIVDLDTLEIVGIYTDEEIEYGQGEQNITYANRLRHFTREKITEEWTGAITKKVEYRNIFGVLPIPFGHDCWEGEWRGQSVFSRALRLIKSTHDILYKRDEILSEFTPKLVVSVSGGDAEIAAWRINNNLADKDSEWDPYGKDFFLNKGGDTVAVVGLPSDFISPYKSAVEDNERKIMMASDMPELFFGGLSTGTQAANDVQSRAAVEYIKSIQAETVKPLTELVNHSLRILAYTNFAEPPGVKIAFGAFDLMSAAQKAQIMSVYAGGMASMMSSGTLTPDGALYFTKLLFSDFPAQTKEDLMNGMKEMITEVGSHAGSAAFEAGDLL